MGRVKLGETTPVAVRVKDRVMPALQLVLKRILRTGELRRRIVTPTAEPEMSDNVIEGENGYGSEYDSPFAQEAENEATQSALAQSQQELSEEFSAAREDILEVQAQMGDIMRVFSILTEAVYNMPMSAENAEGGDMHLMADAGMVVPDAIVSDIDDVKQQLETLGSGLSKTDVAMLTVEAKANGVTEKVARIEQTLPELISMQSDFSGKMDELRELLETNRSEITDLAANTERIDCLYEGFDDMYEIALTLTGDVGDIIARLEAVEAYGADVASGAGVVDAVSSAGGGVAEVEIMPPTAYVKLQSVGNEADHVKIAMELLDFLLKMVGPNNLPSILDYYIEIGWISETARLDLLAYASSLGFAEEKPDWKMSTEDHLKSLWFIDQLCGHKTDKTRLFRVNYEIEKMYKGIDVLYEI